MKPKGKGFKYWPQVFFVAIIGMLVLDIVMTAIMKN
tara:strand:+ start:219 stop:326 length:108 start_codon:yes stop_codon:yes gene_type:complete